VFCLVGNLHCITLAQNTLCPSLDEATVTSCAFVGDFLFQSCHIHITFRYQFHQGMKLVLSYTDVGLVLVMCRLTKASVFYCLKGYLINLLGAFFSFANKVSSTICNVSNFVLTP
jgi:hypothetical protein